jgi:hypothetical protein
MGIEQDPRISQAANDILNEWPFLLPDTDIRPVFIWASGFKRDGKWKFWYWNRESRDLFRNAIISIRFAWPFLFAIQIRWRETGDPSFLQVVIGWKFNGRFALTARAQDDESAARGTLAPNPGFAQGWNEGPK